MNSQIYPLPSRAEFDIVPATHEAALPIGALLVKAGRLTEDNVQRILDYQRKSGLMFGETGPIRGWAVSSSRQSIPTATRWSTCGCCAAS